MLSPLTQHSMGLKDGKHHCSVGASLKDIFLEEVKPCKLSKMESTGTHASPLVDYQAGLHQTEVFWNGEERQVGIPPFQLLPRVTASRG